jgi:hypothetical protein
MRTKVNNMDKQKVNGTVWVYDTPHDQTVFLTNSMDGAAGWVFRGKIEVTVEVDPINKDQAIADLLNSAEDVNAKAASTVRAIMEQIKEIEGES